MANKNISQFPATTTFSPDDLIPIWQGGQSKHISGSLFPYATDSELVATSGALAAFVVAASANAYGYTDAVAATKADITLVAALTGAGLVDAKAYTDAASAALQAEIDAIIQEGTSVTSSGGTILVTQNGLIYNVDVIDPITASEVAALTGASLVDAFAYTDAASAALQTQIDQIVQEGTTITSSAGSITVTQNGTQFNVEVATAPVSNHNDLLNKQGSGPDYYHLNATQFASISGGVDLSAYTPLTTTSAVSAGLAAVDGALQTQINSITATNILNLTTPAAGLAAFVYKLDDGKLYSDLARTNTLIGKANNFVAKYAYDFRETSSSGSGWSFVSTSNVDTEGLTGGFIYTPASADSYMQRDVDSFNPFKYNCISITYKTPVDWTARISTQIYYYDSSFRLMQSPYLDPTYGAWKTEVLEVASGDESVANAVTKIRFDLMNQAGYSYMNIAQVAVGYLGEDVISSDAETLNGLTAAAITGASKAYTDALVAATSGSGSEVTIDTNQTITGIKTFVDLVNVSAGPGVQGCEVKFYDAGDYQGKIEAWNGAMYIISASGNTNVEITDYYGQLNGEWTLDGADPIVGLAQLQSVTGASYAYTNAASANAYNQARAADAIQDAAMSGALVTISANMSANALYHANTYSNSVSANALAQANAYTDAAIASISGVDAETLNGLTAAQITGASKVYTDTVIAGISGFGNAVLTSGNQSISGQKEFTTAISSPGASITTQRFGYKAGEQSTGGANTIVGYYAGSTNMSGEENVIIGTSAGRYSNSGSGNVLIGMQASEFLNGDRNVCIGFHAGETTNSSNSVFIGSLAGVISVSGENNILAIHSSNAVIDTSASLIYGKFDGTDLWCKGNKIWHSGNDGAGSTLDADTVDGLHAADISAASTVYTDSVSATFRNNSKVTYTIQTGTFTLTGGSAGDICYVV